MNTNTNPTTLDLITPDGNSLSVVGPLPSYAGSGSMSFGPDGQLYQTALNSSGVLQLYRIKPDHGCRDRGRVGPGDVR